MPSGRPSLLLLLHGTLSRAGIFDRSGWNLPRKQHAATPKGPRPEISSSWRYAVQISARPVRGYASFCEEPFYDAGAVIGADTPAGDHG